MSKVFRLYKNGDNNITDWKGSTSFPYHSEHRDGKDGIEDPEGASSKNEITSIPSPFARIDLVKTAFVRVCQPDVKSQKVDLDGNTIFHKMVSDTLDVGEIFFNPKIRRQYFLCECRVKTAVLTPFSHFSYVFVGV